MGYRLAVGLTVVAHLAFVAFLLGGGFVASRRPGVLKFHVPAVAVSTFLALGGHDCPLTDLEKWLRSEAGVGSYRGGFVSHYLIEPIHPAGITPGLDVALLLFTAAVITAAYAGLLVQRAREVREDRGSLQRSYNP